MYNTPSAMSTTSGSLAMTGLTGNPIWLVLASFALIALGFAVLRTVPRAER